MGKICFCARGFRGRINNPVSARGVTRGEVARDVQWRAEKVGKTIKKVAGKKKKVEKGKPAEASKGQRVSGGAGKWEREKNREKKDADINTSGCLISKKGFRTVGTQRWGRKQTGA